MEKINELSVFCIRSSRSAISAGYRIYLTNFRKLLRRTWLFGIAFALTTSLLMVMMTKQIPMAMLLLSMPSQKTMSTELLAMMMQNSSWLQIVQLLFMASFIALAGGGFAALNEHQQTEAITPPRRWYGNFEWHTMLRLLVLYIFIAIIMAAVVIAIGLLGFVAYVAVKPSIPLLIAALSVVYFIAMAFMLPFIYVSYKYMLTPGSSFFSLIANSFGIGLRHWGAIFLVSLIVCIISLLLSAFITLPFYILTFSIIKSQMGVMMGDPIGMPDYMNWMSPIVFAVSGFLQAYLLLSALFPFYYLYGSIEQQERERKEMVKTLTQQI